MFKGFFNDKLLGNEEVSGNLNERLSTMSTPLTLDDLDLVIASRNNVLRDEHSYFKYGDMGVICHNHTMIPEGFSASGKSKRATVSILDSSGRQIDIVSYRKRGFNEDIAGTSVIEVTDISPFDEYSEYSNKESFSADCDIHGEKLTITESKTRIVPLTRINVMGK